jgi:cell division protein FtsI (penicillin-binding protein 3)
VYVVIQKPKGAASGGGTAGPVFRKILTYLLQKYAVPPTNTPPAHLPVEW